MTRRAGLAALGVVLGALLSPQVGSAQEAAQKSSFTVDDAQAKTGGKLFMSRGCAGCHTVGKGVRAGPDLAGVVDRRELAWLQKWLMNTTEMLASDPIAQEMLAQYKGTKMPNLKLSQAEADAVIHFMAAETAKQKK
ncbi:MAG TPA: cytochrome c [Longimicrobiales bacterium]